jgi:hypothetical protein
MLFLLYLSLCFFLVPQLISYHYFLKVTYLLKSEVKLSQIANLDFEE